MSFISTHSWTFSQSVCLLVSVEDTVGDGDGAGVFTPEELPGGAA